MDFKTQSHGISFNCFKHGVDRFFNNHYRNKLWNWSFRKYSRWMLHSYGIQPLKLNPAVSPFKDIVLWNLAQHRQGGAAVTVRKGSCCNQKKVSGIAHSGYNQIGELWFIILGTQSPLGHRKRYPVFCWTGASVSIVSVHTWDTPDPFLLVTRYFPSAGLQVEESAIYPRIIQAALAQKHSKLSVHPTIFGERHLPELLASVSSIGASELSLGHVTRALCRGLVENLCSMLPVQHLQDTGVRRVLGSGSALAKNEVLRQEVERILPFPVVYGKDVDAAVGAAMVMFHSK